MILKYHRDQVNLKSLDSQNIDRQIIESVPFGSFVLDIGCASGFIGEYLIKKKNCQVIGLEKRNIEGKIAQKRLSDIIIGDIEEFQTLSLLEKSQNHQ